MSGSRQLMGGSFGAPDDPVRELVAQSTSDVFEGGARAGAAVGDVAVTATLTATGLEGEAAAVKGATSTQELLYTHGMTMSRREFALLKQDIAKNGIKQTIQYVEVNGRKYIVDGNHRVMAARQLGMKTVPTEEVKLPYSGYKTVDDLLSGRGW
jgi:hypothetical protein